MSRIAPTAVPTPARRRPGPLKRLARTLRGGLAIVVVLAVVGGGGWAAASGRASAWWSGFWSSALALTADMGFSVQEVVVIGRSVTGRDSIWQALQIQRGDPILSFDARAARDRIAALPWVASISIERRLPDTLHLRIDERRPLALWQQDGVVRLIDADGIELTQQNLGDFGALPLIVGFGAETKAADLIATLDQAPDLAERLAAAIWVGNRRWDLRLDNGVTIQLPEQDMASAIGRLQAIEVRDGLIDRDIATIDLRLADRLVVRMPPEPALEPELETGLDSANPNAEETT